jgi:hypothetical protein
VNLLKAFRRFLRNRNDFYREHTSFKKRHLFDDLKCFNDWHDILKCKSAPIELSLPWISVPALIFLRTVLHPDMKIFEWGSGGSTLFFLGKGCDVTSVDHSSEWASAVNQRIRNSTLRKSIVEHIAPNDRENFPSRDVEANPTSYRSTGPAYQLQNFRKYVKRIDVFENETFDLVVVDGRARNSCIYHALPKVKMFGYLMLDNAERQEYAIGIRRIPSVWRRTDFIGPMVTGQSFSCTAVWKKYE